MARAQGMRGRDIQDEAREVGKGHIMWDLKGLEEARFLSPLIGKPLQGLRERGDSI